MLSVFDLVDKGGAGGEAALLEAIVEAALLEAIVEAALLEAIGEAESSVNVKEVQGAGRRIAPFAHRVEARAARHDLLEVHALLQVLWEHKRPHARSLGGCSHGARTRCVRSRTPCTSSLDEGELAIGGARPVLG